jgi:two-component system sensor histidine kinase CiaH
MNLFHSARLKLTAFYFASLVMFCLLLTFGVRVFTDHELNLGNDAQRGAVHRLFQEYSGQDATPSAPPPGDRFFANTQKKQATVTRRNLNRDFLIVDVALLAVGAIISYWYAGRTLRPIEAAHEQQKRFTSDASHELRTPLASIKLENEVFLRQKSFTEAEARGLIESNLEEVDRLEKLAVNLLSLSKYEQGVVEHTTVSVTELVNTAVDRVARSKAARTNNFVQDITGATIDVDGESLTELLTILLDNAVKYGPKDGKVTIAGRLEGTRYIITVHDHGPGISDEDLPHIFERMYRGDKARSSAVSGHGIGLSLAYQIAMANNATLEADNHLEGGAVFTLTLQ